MADLETRPVMASEGYRPVQLMREKAAQLREEMTLLTGESSSPKRAMRPTLRVAADPGAASEDWSPPPIERIATAGRSMFSASASAAVAAASTKGVAADAPSEHLREGSAAAIAGGGRSVGFGAASAVGFGAAASASTSAASVTAAGAAVGGAGAGTGAGTGAGAGAGTSMHGPGRRLVSTRHSQAADGEDGGGLGGGGGGGGGMATSPFGQWGGAGAAGAAGGTARVGPLSRANSGASPSSPSRPRSAHRAISPLRSFQSIVSAVTGYGGGEGQQRTAGRMAVLEEELDRWKQRVQELEGDAERRQQSYMRREDMLQTQVEDLQRQLDTARNDAKPQRSGSGDGRLSQALDKSSNAIKDLHTQVIGEIEALLKKQAVVMKHEEATAIRHFKEKLSDIEKQVAHERSRTSSSERELLEKTQGMRQELASTHALAVKLDQMHKLSEEECARLRAQFKCQEDDRQYLVRQIVALKRDNARLTAEVSSMARELQEMSQERDQLMVLNPGGALTADGSEGAGGLSRPPASTAAGGGRDNPQLKLQHYEEVVQSLRRMLEAECRRTRQARAAHTAELQQRGELQAILRQCVDDIRSRRGALEQSPSSGSGSGFEPATANPYGASGLTTAPKPRVRPASAMVAGASAAHASASASAGPGAGAGGRGGGVGPALSSSMRRPSSAALRSARRPFSAGPGLASAAAAAAGGAPLLDEDDWGAPQHEAFDVLSGEERQQLVQELLRGEQLLQQLFTRAFPSVAPLVPGDPYNEELAIALEEEEKQVVATARAIGQKPPAAKPPPGPATTTPATTSATTPATAATAATHGAGGPSGSGALGAGAGAGLGFTGAWGGAPLGLSGSPGGGVQRGGGAAASRPGSALGFAGAGTRLGQGPSSTSIGLPASGSGAGGTTGAGGAGASGRPWALNSDARMAEFLGGGRGKGAAPAGAEGKAPGVRGGLASWGRPLSASSRGGNGGTGR